MKLRTKNILDDIGGLEYLNDYIFMNSGVATVSASTMTTPAFEFSMGANVQAVNPYGCRFDVMIREFNQTNVHTTAQGFYDFYSGGSLNKGTAFSGHLLVEGLKL